MGLLETPLPPPAADAFGERPARRRRGRGRLRLVAGAVLLVAALAAVVAGTVQAITTGARIDADAVVRGTVRAGGEAPGAFTVPAGDRRRFTVYLRFDSLFSTEEEQDRAVRDTACAATMPDGVVTAFRGSRQTVAATIGTSASVGTFSSLPGRVRVDCRYAEGSWSSRHGEPVRFVVAPGAASFTASGVLTIAGGVTVGLLGGWLLLTGLRRRGVPG
jgi:hypothetical protein